MFILLLLAFLPGRSHSFVAAPHTLRDACLCDTTPYSPEDTFPFRDQPIYTTLGKNALVVHSSYIGGDSAWMHLLDSTLKVNKDSVDQDDGTAKGFCTVVFIVSRDGTMYQLGVEPQENALAHILLQLFKDHPNWTPAYVRGRAVNAFHIERISPDGKRRVVQ